MPEKEIPFVPLPDSPIAAKRHLEEDHWLLPRLEHRPRRAHQVFHWLLHRGRKGHEIVRPHVHKKDE
jgi:hypothetical protein